MRHFSQIRVLLAQNLHQQKKKDRRDEMMMTINQ